MRALPCLVALAVIVSLAGCSSSGISVTVPGGGAAPGAGSTTQPGVSAPAVGGGSSAPGGSHSSAGASVPQAGGKLPNVCTLVTAAELSAAAGVTYGKASKIPGSQLDMCHWAGPEIGLDVTLWNIGSMPGFHTMLAGAASKDAPLVTIPGVGQQAIASAAGLVAQVNSSEFVEIEGAPGEIFGKHAADIAVAKLVISKLG
jgi:hypothetical protein